MDVTEIDDVMRILEVFDERAQERHKELMEVNKEMLHTLQQILSTLRKGQGQK